MFNSSTENSQPTLQQANVVRSPLLSDYLHLYLGCKVVGTYNDNSGAIGYLTGVTNGGYDCEIQFILEDGINVEEEPQYNDVKNVKPILRPLSSMTEEEGIEAESEWNKGRTFGETISQALNISNAFRIKYLLSKHFDLFGLIEAGLAIEAVSER